VAVGVGVIVVLDLFAGPVGRSVAVRRWDGHTALVSREC
jgi:hypothetical protein